MEFVLGGFVSGTVQRALRLRFFFLMIRRPPRSTLDRSSAASDVYKRQVMTLARVPLQIVQFPVTGTIGLADPGYFPVILAPVSYTHLRAHETVLDLVCRLLLEKKIHTISPEPNVRISIESTVLRTIYLVW